MNKTSKQRISSNKKGGYNKTKRSIKSKKTSMNDNDLDNKEEQMPVVEQQIQMPVEQQIQMPVEQQIQMPVEQQIQMPVEQQMHMKKQPASVKKKSKPRKKPVYIADDNSSYSENSSDEEDKDDSFCIIS
jgi:hypothetical protein